MADQLRQVLGDSDHASLVEDLSTAGFDLSKRGQNYVVTISETGRKYRLKTLGLENDLAAAMAREKQTNTRAVDDRVKTLLQSRETLAAEIEEHLHDFDANSDWDHER